MNNNEIISQIKTYLVRANKNQSEFALEIGAPQGRVNKWLNKKAMVSKPYQVILIQKGIIKPK